MGLDCIYQQHEEGELGGAAGKAPLELNAETAVMFKQVRRRGDGPLSRGLQAGQGVGVGMH